MNQDLENEWRIIGEEYPGLVAKAFNVASAQARRVESSQTPRNTIRQEILNLLDQELTGDDKTELVEDIIAHHHESGTSQ